jgi:hypothetical protein
MVTLMDYEEVTERIFQKLVSNYIEASRNLDIDFFHQQVFKNLKNHQRMYLNIALICWTLKNYSSRDPIHLKTKSI